MRAHGEKASPPFCHDVGFHLLSSFYIGCEFRLSVLSFRVSGVSGLNDNLSFTAE